MRRLMGKLVKRFIVRKGVVSGGASGRRARPLISGDVSAWQPVAALPSGWLMVTIKGGETLNGFSLPLRVSAGRLVLISWQRPIIFIASPSHQVPALLLLLFLLLFWTTTEEAGDSGDVNKVEVRKGKNKADVNAACRGSRVGISREQNVKIRMFPSSWMPSTVGRGGAALCVILDLHSAQQNHQHEGVI